MVTTKQNLIADMQKRTRKESEHTTRESHQTTKQGKRRKEQRETTKQPENNEQMAISVYLSII